MTAPREQFDGEDEERHADSGAVGGRCLAVVLNWCAEEDTARCISSLQRTRARMSGLDILLADSASPDGSGDRLAARFPEIPYLPIGENLGYAGGNQRAIEWALARGYAFVLLVNDDAEVMPGCVEQLLAALEADPVAGAAAPTITYGPPHEEVVWFGGGRFVWWKGLGVHHHEGAVASELARRFPDPQPVSFLSGCVLLLRAEAIRQSGGLRAEFFAYVEDAELGYRWGCDGWRLVWVASAVSRHHLPYGKSNPSPFAIRMRDRNRRRVAAMHYGWPNRLIFWCFFAVSRFVLVGQALLRGDLPRASALSRGVFSSLN